MNDIREKLSNMFQKVMAGTVTREEGTMLINFLAKQTPADTVKELTYLIDNPPQNVFPKTVVHTIALTRNRLFYDLMVKSLDHKNEEVSILAAEELARLHTSEAMTVLVEHLTSEAYHVRKASALAIAKGFGPEGIEILKNHIMTGNGPFYLSTSINALLEAGKRGMDAIMHILSHGNAATVTVVAQGILKSDKAVPDTDIPKVVEALMRAGDRKDTSSITELLRLVGSFREKAKSYEGFVMAFTDHQSDTVKNEAKHTLQMLKGAAH